MTSEPTPTPPRRSDAWTIRVVPHGDGTPHEYVLTARQLQRLRVIVGVLLAIFLVAAGGLTLTLPRSFAYEGLLHENLALKSRLQEIDRQMAEIDRILLRLRLYDAQLDSMSGPRGDHGPIADDDFANGGLADGEIPLDLPSEAGFVEDAATPGPGGLRPAESWAQGIQARAETFLTLFARAEPNLSQLMEELEGLRALEQALPSLWPSDGVLSSGYGWRKSPFGKVWRFHSGLDVAASRGEPIWAAAPGEVVRAEYNQGYGRMVEIDHGFGITTLYAHCHTLGVKVGDLVERGDHIATVGSTGRSTGPHLHFEVRLDGHAVDPLDYLPR